MSTWILHLACSRFLRRLLKEQDYLSEQALADDLGISKRTVQRELEGTEKALSSYNLKLVRQKRAGILLEGSDTDKNELAEALFGYGRHGLQ